MSVQRQFMSNLKNEIPFFPSGKVENGQTISAIPSLRFQKTEYRKQIDFVFFLKNFKTKIILKQNI